MDFERSEIADIVSVVGGVKDKLEASLLVRVAVCKRLASLKPCPGPPVEVNCTERINSFLCLLIQSPSSQTSWTSLNTLLIMLIRDKEHFFFHREETAISG